MKNRSVAFYISLLILLQSDWSCRKPYSADLKNNGSYLVVEGDILAGPDTTIIKLSRTVAIDQVTTSAPERNAILTVEDDQGSSYDLTEKAQGVYAALINLVAGRTYHLKIKTAAGNTYVSDSESLRNNPFIDSIGYLVKSNSLQLYINTHDPENNTRYYRWEYSETWQFNARYKSLYVSDGKQISLRTPQQQIYSCFSSDTSSTILLGSSANLDQDIIYQSPLIEIPSSSEKLGIKYSILVKQYALTAGEFNFWVNLRKNTEQLGGIFDPQPSQLGGNIHSMTNPGEPVIGYIGVTTLREKRIFIVNSQLPANWYVIYPYQCELLSSLYCYQINPKCFDQVTHDLLPLTSPAIIVDAIKSNDTSQTIAGFTSSSRECADCTLRGFIKTPKFWK